MLKHCHATAIEHQTRQQLRNSRRNLHYQNDNSSLNSSTSSSSSTNSSMIGSVNCSFVGSETSASSSFVLANPAAAPDAVQDSRRSSYSSPEPLSMASRTSSYASLSTTTGDSGDRTTIKIYAKCLRSDIEYKTLSISRSTTSAQVIWMLLSKFKMRHRDPKLFYLTMDIGVAALSRTLSLDDDSRPAELKSCHPWGECKFTLQMRRGGLVRIHDSVLMAESKYKCLLISEQTTVREVITILFHCYGLERIERVDRYVLCEMHQRDHFERRLHLEDCPASIQQGWDDPKQYQFILKRNNVLSLSVPRPVTWQRPPSVQTTSANSGADTSSAMSSPVSTSDSSIGEPEAMDTSYSTNSSAASDSPSPSPDVFKYSKSTRPTPRFNINGPVSCNSKLAGTSSSNSFHQVGLPPVLRPKPQQKQASLLLANGSRGNILLNHHLRTKFHDYENYFYI